MKTTTCAMFGLTTLMAATLANGQEYSRYPRPAQGGIQAYRHASTLQEGVLRGWADLYRGVGEYNYNTASAMLIHEDVRKGRYENELRHADTYWAKKQIYESNKAALQAARKPQHAIELRPAVAINTRPAVDVTEPGLVWPVALERAEFAAQREQLVTLFEQRTPAHSAIAGKVQASIDATTGQMRTALAKLVREVTPSQFVEAKQFLDRIESTSRQPLPVKLAAR